MSSSTARRSPTGASRWKSIPGWVRAWDVRDRQAQVGLSPDSRPGEEGVETWKNDSWAYSGNANVWSIMSADEELGYVYLPTTTPTNDYYGGHRLGDNLFAESLVCVDAKTGKKVWHFQAVHHGLWDYDFPAAPTLLDIVVDGKPVKAVAQVSKQGFVYTFDRVTGKPVWPIEERPVPTQTNVPGEQPSPTQPFPTKPPPFEYQGITIDDLVDFTPELRKMAIEAVKGFTIGPIFTPPMMLEPGKTQGTLFRPSANGGANWGGAGVDPDTGLLYVPSHNVASLITFYKPTVKGANLRFTHGAPEDARAAGAEEQSFPRLPGGLPLFKPPYSRMTAIDMNRGEQRMDDAAWKRRHDSQASDAQPPEPAAARRGRPRRAAHHEDAPDQRDQQRWTRRWAELVAYDKATGNPAGACRSAGRRDRHPDDLHGGRQAVHRADGRRQSAGAGRVHPAVSASNLIHSRTIHADAACLL